MEFLFLIVGICIGFVIAWLIKRPVNTTINNDAAIKLSEAEKQNSALISTNQHIKQEKELLQKANADLQNQIVEFANKLATAEANNKNMNERLETQRSELEQLQARFKDEFSVLANKILEEKTQKFTEQNKINLDGILNPLKEKIKDFEDKVEKVYNTEAAERNMLKGEIKQLMSLNQQMQVDAQNLTKALKGDTKTQGNWGEFILESILEKSGLTKNREYFSQASMNDEEGKRQQPDILIKLPDGKSLILDSKVSLVAYEKYVSAQDEVSRQAAAKEHIQSVRQHIKGLSEKKYQTLYEIKSLDFVLLFMPIEPAFALAVQLENTLFNDAYEKNIIIVSPTTLFATLRTVANIWRYEYQNKNAIEIAKKAGDMHDKFVNFVTDLTLIGNKLNEAQKTYFESMKKLYTGTGNLVKRREDIKSLGVKVSKDLPQSLIDRIEE